MHLLDTTLFYERQSGGVKRYLMAKHEWLAQNAGDIRHTLLVPGRRDGYDPAESLFTVDSPRLPFSRLGVRLPVKLRTFARAIERLAPDLIEAEDPYQLAWTALHAGRRLGIPVVGFYHSDLPEVVGNRFGDAARWAARDYVTQLYRKFDLVLAPSQAMVAKLQALGVEQVIHQPLGVDARQFHPGQRDPQLRESLGLPPNSRLLVYAGRFSPEKKLEVLFQAVDQLGDPWHLLLIGGGMAVHPPANTTVLPFESDDARLGRLLASADIFVHSGDQETFGLAVLEAMACGLPVVGMRAAGVQELVTPECGRLVEPGDSAAMAAAIADVWQAGSRDIGARARARVESVYSWDVVMQGLLIVYRNLALRQPAQEIVHAV